MKEPLHSLLKRQLRRVYGEDNAWPAEAEAFIAAVNEAYHEFDTDRNMIERSLDLSSQELMQANSDLGAVLESFLDLFFHIDREGDILACRVGSHSDLLLKAEDLVGKKIYQVPFKHVGRKFAAAIKKVHEKGTMESMEYGLIIKGELQYYEAKLLPLRNDEIAFIVRNITEQKLLEQQQQELQERLASSERMESLGVLAGGIAHDLNNILGPLVGYPEIIRENLERGVEVTELLDAIDKGSRRAASVITDLLTLARRGNQALEPINLVALVNEFLDSGSFKQLESRHPRCQLNLELDDSTPATLGAPHQVTQVIMNLVINAFEAIEESGAVTISICEEQVEKRAGIYGDIPADTYVVLCVSDTGVGIEEKDVKHIFEPFYSQKKLGRSGSGLGLSVVYGIVQDLNGFIDVDTAPGLGSTIELYLPVCTQPVEKKPAVVESDKGSETILVVDDLPEQRLLAKTLLERWGYTVCASASGHEAVEFLRNRHADLVLMDMIMEEGFDGLDTYKKILTFKPDQKCIIISGYSENARVQEALACGAGAFISKPYTAGELRQAVRFEIDRTAGSTI